MITHNPDAASIAGRILHMRDGEIVKVENGSRSSLSSWSADGSPAAV
jgi:putative ABC transport system ATP-binding protein